MSGLQVGEGCMLKNGGWHTQVTGVTAPIFLWNAHSHVREIISLRTCLARKNPTREIFDLNI